MKGKYRIRRKNLPNTNNDATMMIVLNVVVIFFLHITSYGSIAFIFAFLYLLAKEMQKKLSLFKILILLSLSLIVDISAGLNSGYTASIILLSYLFMRKLKPFNLLTHFISQALAFLIVNFICFSIDIAYIKWFFILEYNLILFLIIYIINIIKRNHI